jgi:hypothetical protein
MMEKIVHTAKQTVKAIVDIASALPGALSWLGAAGEVAVIVGSLSGVGGAALGLDQKSKKLPARPSPPFIRECDFLIGSFACDARHWTSIP